MIYNVASFCYMAVTQLYIYMHLYACLGVQSCQTLCSPLDCSPPGFSVHGIFSGMNAGLGCHFLLQGIFQTQGWKWVGLLCLLHCRWTLYPLSYWGSPTHTHTHTHTRTHTLFHILFHYGLSQDMRTVSCVVQ